MEAVIENAPTSDEVWKKVLTIENKIEAVTSTFGKSALIAMSRITLVALPKFLVFPLIIRSYDFIFITATKDVSTKSVNSSNKISEAEDDVLVEDIDEDEEDSARSVHNRVPAILGS
ncbi:hypothetical protein V6N13_088843 [Hibiscus sabdariffa]|uniref:Uncharacterized protein n=1 Tax=Hibiscus sabdariffa TaxID=183260 RepID=A0ABR1Z923_9ROSI